MHTQAEAREDYRMIGARVPEQLYNAVHALALLEDRSASAVIRAALMSRLAQAGLYTPIQGDHEHGRH
jgi:hypothetical protein